MAGLRSPSGIGKKPTLKGWPSLKLGTEDAGLYFNGAAQNIGVILGPASGGLTDVDLDCSEAVGSYFLPRTDAVFGRASKRKSHFLYFTGIAASDDRATIQFKDPNRPKDEDKGMLLEVRIGGGDKGAQSIFPSSTHEEGEEIRWETDGTPARVEDADLMKAAHRGCDGQSLRKIHARVRVAARRVLRDRRIPGALRVDRA